jgi:hypothetical protein
LSNRRDRPPPMASKSGSGRLWVEQKTALEQREVIDCLRTMVASRAGECKMRFESK